MKSKLEAARAAYEEARSRLDAAVRAIEELPDDAEQEALTAAQAAFDEAEAEAKARKAEIERLERVARAREEHPPLLASEERAAEPRISVGAEPYTYRPDAPFSFFRDLYTAKVQGDREAQERLARHQAETRDVTTGDPGAGVFVPPVYLGEMWAELPRESRPFAAALPTLPLPDVGMSVTVPRITTGTSTAVQAAEGDAVSETDIDGTLLTVNVRTIAGQNDVSRQALERTFPGMDFLIFQDLRADYDETLDTQLISGSGSSGQHLGVNAVSGINTVTYTDSTPTAAELVPKIYDGIQQIAAGRHKAPDLIVMHPRRAAWLASNLSSTFPLFQLGSYVQAAGSQEGGFVQNFAGLRVVQDANISTELGASTDEDEILIVRSADLFLMEGPLRTMVYEQTLSGTLQVRLQVFAYSAFVSGRQPKAIARIRGTGLKAPTF
jgi:HK97 family phage major capsid protein